MMHSHVGVAAAVAIGVEAITEVPSTPGVERFMVDATALPAEDMDIVPYRDAR
jgi:hypothetical protein